MSLLSPGSLLVSLSASMLFISAYALHEIMRLAFRDMQPSSPRKKIPKLESVPEGQPAPQQPFGTRPMHSADTAEPMRYRPDIDSSTCTPVVKPAVPFCSSHAGPCCLVVTQDKLGAAAHSYAARAEQLCHGWSIQHARCDHGIDACLKICHLRHCLNAV